MHQGSVFCLQKKMCVSVTWQKSSGPSMSLLQEVFGFAKPGLLCCLERALVCKRCTCLPALFGVSVGQVNLLVDTLFASLLVVGSISWLNFSDRLMEFPLGVFGVAISTVILPNLSRQHATQSTKTFSFPKNVDEAPYCIDLTVKVEGDARNLLMNSGVPEAELVSGSFVPTLKYRIDQNQKPKVRPLLIVL